METPSDVQGEASEVSALRAQVALLEQQVAQRDAELEVAIRELDGFSYAVAHDLRSPIRALSGFSTRLAELHGDALSPEAGRYLDRIRKNARRMGVMIDGLLACSRSARVPLNCHDVAPRQIVDRVLDALAPERAGRQVEIRIGELLPCHADARLTEQVFSILLSNAHKFTRERAVATIEVGSAPDGGVHRYFVADNGAGFDMQYADKLFGLFQRLHHPGEFEGTGVGLAICQRIVHRHGGRIWAESAPDRGATFSFTLPMRGVNATWPRADPGR